MSQIAPTAVSQPAWTGDRDFRVVLEANLGWFVHSGVMVPNDGLWGVAERVAVTEGNDAIEKMRSRFPAWTDHDGYCIIEQRRADCNFQAAYLFLTASRVLNQPRYYDLGVAILDFLYFRSGLLNRTDANFPIGAWNWSHIRWEGVLWFDDNAWCIALPLEIARCFPELEARYHLRHWAKQLAQSYLAGFQGACEATIFGNPEFAEVPWQFQHWRGPVNQPHWGSLACMALSRAAREFDLPGVPEVLANYHAFLKGMADSWNGSELSYALLGVCAAFRFTGRPETLELARRLGERVTNKMSAEGNLPSEHFEAPNGPHLVDTIYTVNWAVLALQMLSRHAPEFYADCHKVLRLLAGIQDQTDAPQFHGCWRGMFDLQTGKWGGGDRYEGGAGSIYTGWTNAPIALAFALDAENDCLFGAEQ